MIKKQILKIGDRIIAERERLGFSQAAFAKKAGVSRGTQFNYEIGKGSPTATYLLAISKLGADVGFLLEGWRTPPPISFYTMSVGRVMPMVADRLKVNWSALDHIIQLAAEAEESLHAVHNNPSDEDLKLTELIDALLEKGDLLDQVFREIEIASKRRAGRINSLMRARMVLLLFNEFREAGAVDPKIVEVVVKAAAL